MWQTKCLFVILLFSTKIVAQSADTTSSSINKKGLRTAVIITGATYGVALAGLNHLWYKNSERQAFRFFNDNAEWKQVDKLGHFYSAFYLSYGASRGLQHFGIKPRKADWIGALTGFAVLVPIELFDGYSKAYGASVGDIVADGAGSLFYLGQQALWAEIRLHPKFSFSSTRYAQLRPNVLGDGPEELLKDYNGQTYWLSLDIDKFVKFPKWFNIAIGYGATGMIYARDKQHEPNNFAVPYRQIYFSIDPDVSAIRTRSKALKTLFFFVNMIKIPSPTLEFTSKGVEFHAFYF